MWIDEINSREIIHSLSLSLKFFQCHEIIVSEILGIVSLHSALAEQLSANVIGTEQAK